MTASHHWREDKPVEPSLHLDVHITKTQKELLNPTMKQVTRGFILYDVKGTGAREFVAKRRLDMISGNVSSYSRLLNGTKRLKEMEELSSLVASCAEVSADKEAAKELSKKDKEEAKRKKEEKKLADYEAFEEKKKELLPKLVEIMTPFVDGTRPFKELNSYNKTVLQHVIEYFLNSKPPKLSSMKKDQLIDHISFMVPLLNRSNRERDAASAGEAPKTPESNVI